MKLKAITLYLVGILLLLVGNKSIWKQPTTVETQKPYWDKEKQQIVIPSENTIETNNKVEKASETQ
ncbi:MAG: hypothetical protein JKX79_10480 [Labilibaculum sp.]|nr:hypothetical protein [Labilibaculum sp.]